MYRTKTIVLIYSSNNEKNSSRVDRKICHIYHPRRSRRKTQIFNSIESVEAVGSFLLNIFKLFPTVFNRYTLPGTDKAVTQLYFTTSNQHHHHHQSRNELIQNEMHLQASPRKSLIFMLTPNDTFFGVVHRTDGQTYGRTHGCRYKQTDRHFCLTTEII